MMHQPPPSADRIVLPPPPHHHIVHHPSAAAVASAVRPPHIRRTVAAHLDPCALRIHNVPAGWPGADFAQLLQRLGATDIQPLSRPKQPPRHSSYGVRFATAARAYDALWYLHQRQCADRVLRVEYAPHGDHGDHNGPRPTVHRQCNEDGDDDGAAQAEPTRARCAAIAAAMLRHPRLYRAVLHQMRRLNVRTEAEPDAEPDAEIAEADVNEVCRQSFPYTIYDVLDRLDRLRRGNSE